MTLRIERTYVERDLTLPFSSTAALEGRGAGVEDGKPRGGDGEVEIRVPANAVEIEGVTIEVLSAEDARLRYRESPGKYGAVLVETRSDPH